MKRETAMLNLGGCALIASLVGAFWLVSVKPSLARAQQAEELRVSMIEASTRVRTLEQLVRETGLEVQEASDQLESVSIRLVSIDERNTRLADLTALATEVGLDVDEVSPSDPVSGELFDEVKIRLRGRGSFPDVARFMHRLAAEQPDTEVRTFRTAGNGGGENKAVFEMWMVWRALPGTDSRGTSP